MKTISVEKMLNEIGPSIELCGNKYYFWPTTLFILNFYFLFPI